MLYNCINSIVKVSKNCSDVMNKHINKGLAITKEDDEDFENFTKYWICDNVEGDFKVRDHCHTLWDVKVRNHCHTARFST